jgi:hypothetical protein
VGPEWTCPVLVTVPERFEAQRQFRVAPEISGIRPAGVERLFFLVDGRTGSVNIDLRLAPGQKNTLTAYLFDPAGRNTLATPLRPDRDRFTTTLGPADLEPGVWEIDLYASYLNTSPAALKVALQALPVVRTLPESATAKLGQGQAPSATITVISDFPSTFRGEGKGSVLGNVTERDQKVKQASWKKTFSVAAGETGVTFDLSLSPEDFGKFTDTAVQVLDAEGQALMSEGMGYRKGSYYFDPPRGAKAEAKYTLQISAATADPDDDSPSWTFHIRELHRYADPVPLTVKAGKDSLVLYPEHPQDLSLQLKAVPPALPDGAAWLARVTFKEAETEGLQLPLDLKLEPGK